MPGLGTVADGTWQTARFRSTPLMDQLAADHSPSWRGLGVAILQRVVLDKLLPESGQGQPKCRYVRSRYFQALRQ